MEHRKKWLKETDPLLLTVKLVLFFLIYYPHKQSKQIAVTVGQDTFMNFRKNLLSGEISFRHQCRKYAGRKGVFSAGRHLWFGTDNYSPHFCAFDSTPFFHVASAHLA